MYKILLIISIALSGNLFAAKSYTLTIKVISLYDHSPCEGFKVFTVKNMKKVEVGFTNSKGEIVIKELKGKYIDVVAEDPENIHRPGTIYLHNSERIDQTEELFLRLNREYEDSYFSAVDAKYENDSSAALNNIPSDGTSISNSDSTEFALASPRDGIPEFYKYIHMNKEYPHDCYKKNIQGKVYISFTVQKDGTITNVVVLKGVTKSLDDEAVRIIRYAPKLNPALSKGKPVKAIVKMPVSFTLN